MTSSTPVLPAHRPTARTPEQNRTLAVSASGVFLVLVVFTMPLASLATTLDGLGAGPSARSWVLSSMSLGLGVALLTAGALADDLGRRRVFVLGSAVLVLGSLVCAVSPNAVVFVFARIGQGMGGAAILACSLALLSHAFPPGPGRLHAVGVWGASLGAGIAVGPLMSVGVAHLSGWRAPYVVVGIGGVLLTAAARTGLAESRASEPRPLDVPGVLTLTAGLAGLLVALTEARGGLGQVPVLVPGIGGLALVAAFVAVERRSVSPMLDLGLFRRPAFVGQTVAGLATGVGVVALMSFVPTVLQAGLGASRVGSALILLGWSAVSVVTALAARRLPARVSGRHTLAVGMLVVAVGELAMLGATAGSSPLRLLPGLVVTGMASGFVNAALGRQAVASVPPERAGMGSGANNSARYIGSALGVTVVAALATRTGLGAGAQGLMAGWTSAVVFSVVASVIGAVVVWACRDGVTPAAR